MDGHFENTDNYISSKKNEKIFPWKMNYTIKEIALTWTYELES